MIADKLTASDIATSMVVYPKPGQDIETLATRIKAEVPGISTMTGKDFDKQIGGATSILNSILVGHRADQPARRRAVRREHDGDVDRRADPRDRDQARDRRQSDADRPRARPRGRAHRVHRRCRGLILGAIVVTVVNEAGRSSGTVLFELTAGTAITAVAFSTILGALAGFVPALHAARLDPVTALRYE